MIPILCYGVPEGCSFGSIVALEWLGQPYNLCRVDMPETVSSAAYRRLNAVGETPTLVTADGHILSESMAILGHIGAIAHRTGAGPATDSVEYARTTQMLAYLNTSFFNAFSPLWYVLEHAVDDAEQSILTSYGRTLVEKTHADLEGLLGTKPWLMGDEVTVADAYFMGIARWADFHQAVDRAKYPGLNRLYETLKDDPAVRFAGAIEHEAPAESAGGFKGHVTLDAVIGAITERAA